MDVFSTLMDQLVEVSSGVHTVSLDLQVCSCDHHDNEQH